jgi:hypothetical protein
MDILLVDTEHMLKWRDDTLGRKTRWCDLNFAISVVVFNVYLPSFSGHSVYIYYFDRNKVVGILVCSIVYSTLNDDASNSDMYRQMIW